MRSLTFFVTVQGKLFVRGDSKIFRFQNGKSESLFLQRKNPRRIAWTVLYRRQHKKGITEVSTPFYYCPCFRRNEVWIERSGEIYIATNVRVVQG